MRYWHASNDCNVPCHRHTRSWCCCSPSGATPPSMHRASRCPIVKSVLTGGGRRRQRSHSRHCRRWLAPGCSRHVAVPMHAVCQSACMQSMHAKTCSRCFLLGPTRGYWHDQSGLDRRVGCMQGSGKTWGTTTTITTSTTRSTTRSTTMTPPRLPARPPPSPPAPEPALAAASAAALAASALPWCRTSHDLTDIPPPLTTPCAVMTASDMPEAAQMWHYSEAARPLHFALH